MGFENAIIVDPITACYTLSITALDFARLEQSCSNKTNSQVMSSPKK